MHDKFRNVLLYSCDRLACHSKGRLLAVAKLSHFLQPSSCTYQDGPRSGGVVSFGHLPLLQRHQDNGRLVIDWKALRLSWPALMNCAKLEQNMHVDTIMLYV